MSQLPVASLTVNSRTLWLIVTVLLSLSVCAIPASAQQPYELDLDSGTANYSNTVVSAAGSYQYYGDEALPGPLPSDPSTVQILHAYGSSTATVSGGMLVDLQAYDTGTINFSGGTIEDTIGDGYLETNNSSTANVSGGDISRLLSEDSSVVNFSGGAVDNLAFVQGSSTLNMTGGSIGSSDGSTEIDAGATANVSGGSIDTLSDFGTVNLSGSANLGELDLGDFVDSGGSGTAQISGGEVPYIYDGGSSLVNITGGSLQTLVTDYSGVMNLFGNDFLETPLDQSGYAYQVTGILEDGQKLNVTYDDAGGSLVFHDVAPVPEASTTVSLGLLLALGLSGLILKKRRVCPEGRKLC